MSGKTEETRVDPYSRSAEGFREPPRGFSATIRQLGPQVFANAFDAREGKIATKFGKLMPLIQAAADEVNAMPSDTRDQRKAKMDANFDKMIGVGEKMRQ